MGLPPQAVRLRHVRVSNKLAGRRTPFAAKCRGISIRRATPAKSSVDCTKSVPVECHDLVTDRQPGAFDWWQSLLGEVGYSDLVCKSLAEAWSLADPRRVLMNVQVIMKADGQRVADIQS